MHHPAISFAQTLLDLAASLRIVADKAEVVASTLKTNVPVDGLSADDQSVVMDPQLFSVRWNGQVCFLGNTIAFRLMERLVRWPNQYVTYEQLLDEIWGGPRSRSAVRSAMNDLRSRLMAAGMADLAAAIDGKNAGCYGLMLTE